MEKFWGGGDVGRLELKTKSCQRRGMQNTVGYQGPLTFSCLMKSICCWRCHTQLSVAGRSWRAGETSSSQLPHGLKKAARPRRGRRRRLQGRLTWNIQLAARWTFERSFKRLSRTPVRSPDGLLTRRGSKKTLTQAKTAECVFFFFFFFEICTFLVTKLCQRKEQSPARAYPVVGASSG